MQPGMGPKIREMLEEAENERMHLMIFIDIAKPNAFERWLVLFAQFIFIVFYFILFVFFPKTAHRMIHYFEREAVISYTHYLKLVDDGEIENIPATKLAKQYYNLKDDATLRDIIIKIRADEEKHAQVNYRYSLD